jgi:hypothetical protein
VRACKRSDGTTRAHFQTMEEAEAFEADLWLANCYFAHDSPEFQRNVTMLHCVENR